MVKQSDIDRACDQAATQAVAFFRSHIKTIVKEAIRELARDAWSEFVHYLLTENWVRLLAALIFGASVLLLYIKEHT